MQIMRRITSVTLTYENIAVKSLVFRGPQASEALSEKIRTAMKRIPAAAIKLGIKRPPGKPSIGMVRSAKRIMESAEERSKKDRPRRAMPLFDAGWNSKVAMAAKAISIFMNQANEAAYPLPASHIAAAWSMFPPAGGWLSVPSIPSGAKRRMSSSTTQLGG